MPKKIDTKKVEECIRELLIALGDDPNREGLLDTPKRVAKMYEEVFEGMTLSNEEIAKMFGTTFENEEFMSETHKNMVVVRDIPIHSYCEHHLALMYDMKVSVKLCPHCTHRYRGDTTEPVEVYIPWEQRKVWESCWSCFIKKLEG